MLVKINSWFILFSFFKFDLICFIRLRFQCFASTVRWHLKFKCFGLMKWLYSESIEEVIFTLFLSLADNTSINFNGFSRIYARKDFIKRRKQGHETHVSCALRGKGEETTNISYWSWFMIEKKYKCNRYK